MGELHGAAWLERLPVETGPDVLKRVLWDFRSEVHALAMMLHLDHLPPPGHEPGPALAVPALSSGKRV